MNRKWLALGLLAINTAICSGADSLQFTNITVRLFSSLTNGLNAVAYGGSSNFLAVGDKQAYVIGNFTPTQPWFTSANWVANRINSNGSRVNSNLTAVACSGNLFLASGDNNWVFCATNIFLTSGLGLNWPSNNAKVFNNNVLAAGVAYNGGRFVTVGEAPEIGWVSSSSPTATNWNLATIVNPSFAESFRGLTPYGTNGFAACGIFGDVRFSYNGTNWMSATNGKVGQPDFSGIACDGTNTFVCVGATNSTTTTNGIIMASTNGGGAWKVVYTNDLQVSGSALNAVAYTGSGFMAVGNNGQILTSSNGLNWTNIPLASIPVAHGASAANVNFLGVTFAPGGLGNPSNYMHDIGEIVGADGNVIITAPPPPTNNSLGSKWICVGVTNVVQVGTNTALPANTLQVTNAWGTNAVTVDWFNFDGTPVTNGTVFIANGMFSYTPLPMTINTNNYTNTYYAQPRDLRTGFTNTWTPITLTNFMRPTAAMVTTNIICNGDSTTLTNLLTGNGPWTNYWTDGFTSYTNTVSSSGVYYADHPYTNTLAIPCATFNPTNLFLNAATNHNYWVWKLSDTYFHKDDPTNLNLTGTNWSGDLNGTDLVTVNPRPTATSVTTNTICNGDSMTLTNILTGLGPWTVYWTDGFSNYTQMATNNLNNGAGPYTNCLTIGNSAFNPTNLFLNAPTNHYYNVYALSDANCSAYSSDLTGTNQVTVNPRPTAT
jgi:hypothetical protein